VVHVAAVLPVSETYVPLKLSAGFEVVDTNVESEIVAVDALARRNPPAPLKEELLIDTDPAVPPIKNEPNGVPVKVFAPEKLLPLMIVG
jgi:hypothetical protein